MEWLNPKYEKRVGALKKKFSGAKPFPHLVLKDFFSKDVEKVAAALVKERFQEQNSDLFQFEQTNDLKQSRNAVLKEFHSFFGSKEFIKFIGEITGRKLKTIDMSGFIYDDADYLLPHDDRLEGRKIAYIVNLSKGFTKSDGGALQLFKGTVVVKSIVPSFNTLTIFEVSKDSVHQVQEVVSNKKRVSLAGWFHG